MANCGQQRPIVLNFNGNHCLIHRVYNEHPHQLLLPEFFDDTTTDFGRTD
ncbi:hypothetical protein Sjap_018525 [Stephania japonica]|uniref:Uncharacterized protein n=1 Tax=Stephania japonica TaxID=461633 RepID=A0AAP0I884_9MAGN